MDAQRGKIEIAIAAPVVAGDLPSACGAATHYYRRIRSRAVAIVDALWVGQADLAPIRDPALVVPSIAQALGVIEMGGQLIEERLQDYLRAKRLLLLLDNFEQVIDAAPLVADLLAAAPGLKALVTSRATLHLYGEHEFAVPPLALPPTDDHATEKRDVITQYESVRLFIARARAAKADFTVTNANALAVAEICHRLDGLPLAVEALDRMPTMRIFHQHVQRCAAGEVAPVIGPSASALARRSFADQPPAMPLAHSILTPRPHCMKFSHQPATAPRAPTDGAPMAPRPCPHDDIHTLQPWHPASRERHPEVRPDRDHIALAASFQPVEKVGIVAVIGIGCDTGVRNAPGIGLIQQCQGQLGLGLKLNGIGNVGLGPSCRIRTPRLRQIQPGRHRPCQGALGIHAGHSHLAVGDFANRACILACHTDRSATLFEKAGIIELS